MTGQPAPCLFLLGSHFQFDAYFSLIFSKMSSKWPTAPRKNANVFIIIIGWLWNWLFLVPKTWTMIYTHLYTLVTSFPGFFWRGALWKFPARFNGGKLFPTTIKEKGLLVLNILPPKSRTTEKITLRFYLFFVYSFQKKSDRFYDNSKFFLLDLWKENFKPDLTVGSFFTPR